MHVMSTYSDGTSENWWLLGVDWSLQAEMAPLYLGLKAFLICLIPYQPQLNGLLQCGNLGKEFPRPVTSEKALCCLDLTLPLDEFISCF